jgi:glycosyltransferase involved in cell wall biosynthesis
MIGSGEMEGDLRALALNLGIENVRFVGFVNQSKMPEMYAACDVFVLPSKDEPWGLAINEAMCAGLPIAVSREVGCVPDLIHEGRNGFTFSGGDIAGIARALRPLLSDEGLRRRMADASRAIISGWSYAECREGLMNALERTRIQGRDVRQR